LSEKCGREYKYLINLESLMNKFDLIGIEHQSEFFENFKMFLRKICEGG